MPAYVGYDARVRIFWTLVTACVLALGVYFYAIHSTIRYTAERQDLEGEVALLAAESSSLEFAYINKRNEIGIELASAYGLREVKTPVYVSRARAGVLTLNTAR